MSRWFEHVDGLLYDGEDVERRVDVGAGGVVVTTHRVLTFTPDSDGSNFESIERPNVVGVDQATRGETMVLAPAIKTIVIGAVLVVAGQVISLDGLVGDIDLSGAGQLGLGGMLATMQSLLNLLALLDDVMIVGGALGLLFGVVLLGVYALSREALLVVEVAGDDDLELAVPDDVDDDEALADRLDRAVHPEPAPEPDGQQASGQDPLV